MPRRRWSRVLRIDHQVRTADEGLYTTLREILRGAPSCDQAEVRMAEVVKNHILPRPQGCKASVVWSLNPDQRSAQVIPSGYPLITIEAKAK